MPASDVILGGSGDDNILGGDGADMLYGEGGADRIFAGSGDDMITGGYGRDTVMAGSGDDMIVGTDRNAGNSYYGEEGTDTLDLSAFTTDVTADLGNGLMGRGQVSSEYGTDTIWDVENIVTGSGDDVITASDVVNVMDGGGGNDVFRFQSVQAADGDMILGFQPGDRIDLSGFDAVASMSGSQSFTLVSAQDFLDAGKLMVSHSSGADGEVTIIAGNVSGNDEPDFRITLKGTHNLTQTDFIL